MCGRYTLADDLTERNQLMPIELTKEETADVI